MLLRIVIVLGVIVLGIVLGAIVAFRVSCGIYFGKERSKRDGSKKREIIN